jgi:hypothetical protein
MAELASRLHRLKCNFSLISAPDTRQYGAGAGGIRLTRKQRSYAPQLTAATYKYFIRGKGAKAAASDVVIQARRKAKLREFDTLLKHFRCGSDTPDIKPLPTDTLA